jgi:hypothetical protein
MVTKCLNTEVGLFMNKIKHKRRLKIKSNKKLKYNYGKW